MTGRWAPDCDCDAMDQLAHQPVRVRRFATDREAMERYRKLGPDRVHTEAIHGPSGHLLAVIE